MLYLFLDNIHIINLVYIYSSTIKDSILKCIEKSLYLTIIKEYIEYLMNYKVFVRKYFCNENEISVMKSFWVMILYH